MNNQKKIAAIHDISCLGKCSLTVALPLLSSAGFETCPVPTAVLSTHTGGFTGFTFKDLTDQIMPIANHWKSIDVKFDAIYSGYLGSFEQLDLMEKFINMFSEKNTLVMIDPVMADQGVLYSGFDKKFVTGMANLCRMADIIVPNITEACFMTDTPYIDGVQTPQYIENLVKKLSSLCEGKIVLTGVSFEEDKIGAATFDGSSINYIFGKKLNVAYHGTGDVFASTLLAALLHGFSLEKSAGIAIDFIIECILRTMDTVGKAHYGVNFELCIRTLLDMLEI
ncbi:MAG: pyridoxamine kinase [Bacillota bacterium]|nr:pyridoxamine kinase [Bacillota bacterium]